ncbi:hypothetical protein VaNZ11_009785, partial [Volvox africanus]
MQLDVLSVFQLPAASSSQSGQFFLQEDGTLTLKEFREQQRRGFSWSSTCGLFACTRQSRYAVDLDSSGAAFVLVKGVVKPSAWVLAADEDGRPGSVRLEPLRGTHHQPPAMHAPCGLPYDDLLGMGLPPTFERGESPGDGSVLAPSTTSCQIVVEPPLGAASSCTRLIGHAYWRSACPGKIVLAIARCDAVEAKSSSAEAPKRPNGTIGSTDEWQNKATKQTPTWHWLVLLVTEEFKYVGPALQQSGQGALSVPPSQGPLPTLTAVHMSWHPQGSALAIYLRDSDGRSCVAGLDGSSLEVLWHRRLTPESEGLMPTDIAPSLPAETCASSMAWVPNTSLLAVIDNEGQLQLLDARGSQRGATLLSGAIKYGESTLLQLAPIIGMAAQLPAAASNVLYESLVLGRVLRSGDGNNSGIGNGSIGLNGDPFTPAGRRSKPCFSLAFAVVQSSMKATSPIIPSTVATVAAGEMMMAVCNGTSVALVRVCFSDEPATPAAQYRRGFNGAFSSVGAGGLPPSTQVKPSRRSDESPDRDLVPALRSDGLQMQIDGLIMDTAPSFGNSAVSTHYMLGLQRVSTGGSSTATGPAPLASRSTLPDAPVPAVWPLRWRTILTLPPLGAAVTTAVGATAYINPLITVPSFKAGPPSLTASSTNPGMIKLDRGATPGGGWVGAFPSPVCSTANLLDPSMNEAASSSAWDAALMGAAEAGDSASGPGGARNAYNDVVASWGPAATGGSAVPAEELLCTAAGPLLALQQGNVLVLRGSIAESLQHYPRANVYGFLPAFLALVHLHQIDAAARLLRAYAHFTGRVAIACTGSSLTGVSDCDCDEGKGAIATAAALAGGAGSPKGSAPSAAALALEWQTTMASILDGPFAEHVTSSVGGAAGVGTGAGAGAGVAPDVGRLGYCEISPKWQNALQQVQEHPVTLESRSPTADCQASLDLAGGKAAASDKRATNDAVASVAVKAHRSDVPVPEKQQSCGRQGLPDGQENAGVREEAEVLEEPASLHPDGDASGGSPLPSPSSGLRDMFRVCLQLLLLACHAMAFVTFSAHSAGRAAAAAADVLSHPMSPTSPRSPGAGVLSRQVIRRLSSTVRMRSLKTRSASMFGSQSFGSPAFGNPLSNQQAPTNSIHASAGVGVGVGFGVGAAPINRMDSATSHRGGGTATVSGTAASRQPPAAASVVIGFPIPVVWQPRPQPHSQPQRPSSTRGGGGGGVGGVLSLSQVTAGRSAVQNLASGPSGNVSRAGTFGGTPTEPSISFAASNSVVASHSPPSSPRSTRHQSQPQPPGSMRLQLHHCAFDVTCLWRDASTQQLPLGQSAATVYLRPSYAAGLLLMAHACSVHLQDLKLQQHPNRQQLHQHRQQSRDDRRERLHHASSAGEQQQGQGQQQQHQYHHTSVGHAQFGNPYAQGGMLRGGGSGAGSLRPPRVNWQLLRATAAATHAAAVWQQLSDWRRAVLLAFACANALAEQGGGFEDLVVTPFSGARQRNASEERSAEGATASLPQDGRQSAASGHVTAGAGMPDSANVAVSSKANHREGPGGVSGRCGILAAARASCLRMGQRVLLSQVIACQKMEVQDACGVMLELVALPRRLLGLHSAVHVSLLQKVCTRILDLLPARVNITPLLPAGSVPPLLQLSHAGIRSQLVAHCGAAVARVLEELRLAAACSGGAVALRDAVQQISEHSTVDSCVRMLLRWQGSYDGTRVDAAAARLAESVPDATLLPDTSDWSPETVLPSLQDAFIASGLLSVHDAAEVVKAAQATAVDVSTDTSLQLTGGLAKEQPSGRHNDPGYASADPSQGLQDLDELALLLDLTQLQHTLLASLQPFLLDALLALRGSGAAKDAAARRTTRDSKTGPREEGQMRAAFGSPVVAAWGPLPGSFGEDDYEEELADSSTLVALPPVELATSCLKLLLKLQWAMHCRAQVCALMLRLVQLQAQSQQPTSFTSPAAPVPSTSAPAPGPSLIPAPTAAAGAGGVGSVCPADTARDGSQSLVHPGASLSSGQIHVSPRSFSHSPIGHRSFRDYIQQMAAGTVPAGQTVQVDMLMQHQYQHQHQQSDLQAPQHQQQPSQHVRHQQRETGSVAGTPGDVGPIRAAAHSGAGSSGAAVGSVSLPPPQQLDPASELEHVQGSLMAWTAALVRADVFHSSNELQGCVLTVLGVVKACPLVLVTALNGALERREILNKALAEQVRRLQRSAAQHPAPPPPPPAAVAASFAPQQTRGATATATATAATVPASESTFVSPAVGGGGGDGARGSVFSAGVSVASFRMEGPARMGSLVLPGGTLAPAPSFAMTSGSSAWVSDSEVTTQQASATADSMTSAVGAVGSLTRDRAGSFALPGLPLGRLGSMAKRGISVDNGLGVVAEAADGGDGEDDANGSMGPPQPPQPPPQADRSAPSVAPALIIDASCATAELQANGNKAGVALPASVTAVVAPAAPAEAKSGSTQIHPLHFAVAMAQADIHNASLKLLEYYADPSGAMPSGLSHTAAAAAGRGSGGFSGGVQPGLGNGAGLDSRHGAWAPADSAARTPCSPSAAVTAVVGSSSSSHGSGRKEHRRPRSLSRSQTVSRGTSHSTLLQCLVCELVRTSHSVTASVSWRATLEGGRGLAGCFLHPILHGGSGATLASIAAAAAAAATVDGPMLAAGTPGKRRPGKIAAATATGAAKSRTAWMETATAEEVEGLGSVPGFVPGAEGAQALLLSLLDVRQWGLEVKQLPAPLAQDRVKVSATAGRGRGRGQAMAEVAAGAEALAEAQGYAPTAAVLAEGCEELEETGGVTAETSEITDPRVTDDDGRSYDGGTRALSVGSVPGTTSRLSFSGLTDGDNDSGGYPTPTAHTARSIEARTPRDRATGHSTIRHHTNPAFGLHSPTPSNVSEFWEEASDLASESTMATALPIESRLPSGATVAAADARMYWRAGSSPVLTDGGPSPQGTRSASPELPMSGGSRLGSGMEGRKMGTGTGAGGAASPGAIASFPATTLELPIKLDSDHSPRQGVTKSTGDGSGRGAVGSSSSGDVQAPAVREEEVKEDRAAAAAAAASDGEGDDGGSGASEPEQLPTLSYLVNVQTLSDIRRAVREAHGDLSVPLVAERSCSFSAVQAASSATSMSEVSVRRGVSGILATDVWPGLEAHDGPPTDPRVVRESGGTDTADAAKASISISDAVPDAAMAIAATTIRRGNGAECALHTACVGNPKEFDLTFSASPTSPKPVELRAAGGKEVASGASSALAVPPRASVNTSASGGCDHSSLHSACVGVADSEAIPTLPQLHATPHSPLPQTPTPGAMTTTIMGAISATGTGTGGSDGGSCNTPSSPPLPLPFNDFSAGQASGYHHHQQQQHLGASSPSAGSAASSISLASPRLATASGSGISVAKQSYGYTPSHGSLLLTPGSGPQFGMPPHHAHVRGSSAGRQQPQLQPHPIPPKRMPQTIAAARGGRGSGVLQRSTSASAAMAAASRVSSLSPPLPPPGASQLTPALRAGSHDSPVSTPTSPSVSQIQIQDFLREPSTSSSLSPRALGSEFFRTPGSAGTSNTKSTTSVTSAGLGTGREVNNFTTVSPATVSTALSPSASASASTSVVTGVQRSPDRQLLGSHTSPGSSTTRPGFGARKTS